MKTKYQLTSEITLINQRLATAKPHEKVVLEIKKQSLRDELLSVYGVSAPPEDFSDLFASLFEVKIKTKQ